MTFDPGLPTIGWIIVGVSAVVALILCLTGALRVVRGVRALKRRLELYADLPVVRVIAETQARVAAAQLAFADVPLLLGRAQAALAEIQAGIQQVVVTATVVRKALTGVRDAMSWLTTLFGRSSRALRSRGS